MKVAHLPSRALLRVRGVDKAEFLQGLITNDIQLLDTQPSIYACLLTPQGKYLYDFFVIPEGDSLLMECEEAKRDELLRKLTLHKLRSDVSLTEDDRQVFVSWGDVLNGLSGSFQDPRLKGLGSRCYVKDDIKTNSCEQNYVDYCHELGVPYHSLDLIPKKSILLESNLDELNAISWNKGCYMGQELTARTKHRGLVRKRLFPVKLEKPSVSFDTDIIQEGNVVGQMRDSHGAVGLALLRLDAFEAYEQKKHLLRADGVSLQPYSPDWMDLCVPSSSIATKSVKAPGNS